MWQLKPHPDHPPKHLTGLSVMASRGKTLNLTYACAPGDGLKLPPPADPLRADGLWKSTCFEMFLRPDGGPEEQGRAYSEFNFSPSGQWACYDFTAYREGMAERPMRRRPHIHAQQENGLFLLHVSLDPRDLPEGPLAMALTAVIDDQDGTKSYWSLFHPPGKPDFHHPACFTARLDPTSTL